MPSTAKWQKAHDIPDLSELPPGQVRAVIAFIGGGRARTYPEAAGCAGISLGTLHTHLRRVRQQRPDLYTAIRKVSKAQLEIRHKEAVYRARERSRAYFRRRDTALRRCMLYLRTGHFYPELDW